MSAPTDIVGLGTLAALKAAGFPALPAENTQSDAAISAIGRGVAAMFDKYTGRTLARVVDAQWIVMADRSTLVLPGYPVEAFTKIEMRFIGETDSGISTGVPVWTDYTNSSTVTLDADSGLLDLQYCFGTALDRLRITYTGGYWLDDGTACPAGATPLPPDLFSAWTLQVATEFQGRDVLGVGALRDVKSATLAFASGLTLAPMVMAILDSYRRFGS